MFLYMANMQQKYNVPVTISLIQAGILNTSELDERLSRLMREGNKLATLFTANLIREAVLTPNPAAERIDFQACLSVIDSMMREVAPLVPKTVKKLWLDLREEKTDSVDADLGSDDDLKLNESYVKVFAEWVTLVSNPTTRRAHRLALATTLFPLPSTASTSRWRSGRIISSHPLPPATKSIESLMRLRFYSLRSLNLMEANMAGIMSEFCTLASSCH